VSATTTVGKLLQRRELVYMLAWREIAIKYKQSVMGVLWAILMPALIVMSGIIVKFAFASVSGEPLNRQDVAIVSVKAIPWAFFVASLRFATNSLIMNRDLVTKVYLPREVFPVASVLSQLVDFGVATVLLAAVLAIARVGVSVQLVWVPLLVGLLVVLCVGLGIFLSAASLFFRDVKYLVEAVITFAIFFTPIFYDVAIFGRWADALMLNPVAPILEGLSAVVVLHRPPPLGWVAYSAVVVALVWVTANAFFRKMEPYFAESI
jgi:homopolymeric O-antigen transport system permease protein